MAPEHEHARGPGRYPMWEAWPVSWSAIWIGALTALAVALVIGLMAIALGAHQVGTRLTDWHKFGAGTLIFGICGAFFANAAGGWVAGRIAGIRHAEQAMLHGGIVWAMTIPMVVVLAALGAGSFLGPWGTGLAGTPAWVANAATATGAQAATVARNEALGALLSLLVGLVGAAVGGWMASGEPMSLMHRRERDRYDAREYVSTGAGTEVHVKPVATS